MSPTRFLPSPSALAVGIALFASGCSSTQTLQSAPAAPVTVDGSEADWQGALRPVEGRSGLVVGTRTDDEALYVIAVLRGDQQVRQTVAGGLTLWLDPGGGTERALGVRFPLGVGGGGPGAGGRPGRDGTADALQARFASATENLEVLRNEADPGVRLPATSATGIQAAASLDRDVLVVEYRVPLTEGAFALGASPGTPVGLGLTTPEIQRPEGERPGGGRAGGAGGGRGGASGGGPPGGGRGQGGGRPGGEPGDRPSALDVWVRVTPAPASTG